MSNKILFSITLSALMFGACSDNDDGVSSSIHADFIVKAKRELGLCTLEKQNQVAYVKDENAYYLCKDEVWEKESTESTQSSSSKKEDGEQHSSSSSEELDNNVQEISSSSVKDDNDKQEVSSSSKKEDEEQHLSSSSEELDNNVQEISSSSVKTEDAQESSSSSLPVKETLEEMINNGTWMWNGYNGDTSITTGFGQNHYWFPYSDMDGGGLTTFTWDYEDSWNYTSNSAQVVTALTAKCKSICGVANLQESEHPDGAGNFYAGIGFNIVNDSKKPADITDWNGFTIVYTSDIDLTLGIEEENRSSYKYDDFRATLPAATEPTKVTVSWEDFAQSGIGAQQELSKILKNIVMVDLQYFSKTSVQTEFKIYAIGQNSK